MERLKQKDRTEAEDRGAQGERGGAAEGEEKVKEGGQEVEGQGDEDGGAKETVREAEGEVKTEKR